MKITLSDLAYLKNIYDEYMLKTINDNSMATKMEQERLKQIFIEAGKLYYGSVNLTYQNIIKLYNEDMKQLNNQKRK